MGTIDSKFCQLLMTDNLEEALEFWQAHEELHSKLNMGQGLKGARNRDPPLHCLLRHGNCRSPELKELLQTFLDRGANPLILNNMDETALHIVCCSQRQGARENKARSEILDILIQRLPSCDSSQKTAKGGNTRKLTEWLEMQDVVSVEMCKVIIAVINVLYFLYSLGTLHFILLLHQVYWTVLRYNNVVCVNVYIRGKYSCY